MLTNHHAPLPTGVVWHHVVPTFASSAVNHSNKFTLSKALVIFQLNDISVTMVWYNISIVYIWTH